MGLTAWIGVLTIADTEEEAEANVRAAMDIETYKRYTYLTKQDEYPNCIIAEVDSPEGKAFVEDRMSYTRNEFLRLMKDYVRPSLAEKSDEEIIDKHMSQTIQFLKKVSSDSWFWGIVKLFEESEGLLDPIRNIDELNWTKARVTKKWLDMVRESSPNFPDTNLGKKVWVVAVAVE